MYAGRVAGSFATQQGGGANYLCLPEKPEFSKYTAGTQIGRAYLHGTEYETGSQTIVDHGPFRSVSGHNAPCAVCFASERENVLMIPARLTCPPSWTREYYGYLIANANANTYQRSMYECVDHSPQSIPGSAANTNGALF